MPAFEAAFLQTIEDAAVNASAPLEQLWLDGWLVRRGREKAKRARCILAMAVGRSSLFNRIGRASALYEAAGLSICARLTPFSQPPSLEEDLTALGWNAFDESRVMVCARIPAEPMLQPLVGCHITPSELSEFAEVLGRFQGASAIQQAAHAERLQRSPVIHEALVAEDDAGRVIACGEAATEGRRVGLYGIHTAHDWRGRGLAASVCAALLKVGSARGASVAYLQVEADNAVARRLYARFGFVDAYSYRYMAPPEVG